MPIADKGRAWRAGGLAALAYGAILLSGAAPARGEGVPDAQREVSEPAGPKCLTPAAADALRTLVAAKGLESALGGDFTLERADVSANQIELAVQDRDHHSYGITLAVPGVLPGPADREGRLFLFRLQTPFTPPNPSASAALLAAAALVDQAVPATSLVSCSGGGEPQPRAAQSPDNGSHSEPWRFPLALALLSAVVQVLVIVAAIVFGLRTIRSRGPTDPDS